MINGNFYEKTPKIQTKAKLPTRTIRYNNFVQVQVHTDEWWRLEYEMNSSCNSHRGKSRIFREGDSYNLMIT